MLIALGFCLGFGAAYLVGWLHLRSTERKLREDEIAELLQRLEEACAQPQIERVQWSAEGSHRAH